MAEKTKATFTQAQLAASQRYAHRKDLIRVLLEPDKGYTLSQVEAIITKFLRGKVS